jgi:hypothetical protein
LRRAKTENSDHIASAWTRELQGRIFNPELVEQFFRDYREWMPAGATPDQNLVPQQQNQKRVIGCRFIGFAHP